MVLVLVLVLVLVEVEVEVEVEASSPLAQKAKQGLEPEFRKRFGALPRSVPTRARGPGPRARRPQQVWRATEPVHKKGQAQQFRGSQKRFRQRSLLPILSTDVR